MTRSKISVVDKQAVWHVETDTGTLSGAWLDEPVDTLVAGSIVVHPGDGSLSRVADAIAAEAKRLGFPTPDTYTPNDYTYHGEPAAEDAWRYARAFSDTVQEWLALEAKRRGRKALAEEYGSETRALPGLDS